MCKFNYHLESIRDPETQNVTHRFLKIELNFKTGQTHLALFGVAITDGITDATINFITQIHLPPHSIFVLLHA